MGNGICVALRMQLMLSLSKAFQIPMELHCRVGEREVDTHTHTERGTSIGRAQLLQADTTGAKDAAKRTER